MTERAANKPEIVIASEVTRRIRQHARSHMKTEVCGVLIGERQEGVLRVEASIEALHAAQAGTHVTFTQDAWEAIYQVKDKSYPEQRIVGWYHSHPGFGVFLSEHDTFIHENFFSSPDQVAWVYDPHTDEEGCFGWVDGAIHRIESLSLADSGGDGVERIARHSNGTADTDSSGAEDDGAESSGKKQGGRTRPSPWLSAGVGILSHLSALLLGFAIAYFVFPRLVAIPVNPVTGEPLLEFMRRAPAHQSPPDPASSPSKNAPSDTPTHIPKDTPLDTPTDQSEKQSKPDGNRSDHPGGNKAGDNKAGDNKAGDNKAGDNKAGDNRAGGNRAGDNKGENPGASK